MSHAAASAPREVLAFHLAFGLLTLPVVLYAEGTLYGTGVLVLAVLYNLALPGYALFRRHHDWLARWAFLLPVSIGQVLPDWALVDIAGTLQFPDHGVARIGDAIPLYFMGLWIMLLFPVTLLADASGRLRYPVVILLGGSLFAVAEWAAPMLRLWQPVDTPTRFGIAPYTVAAEILLCIACLWAYRNARYHGVLARLWSAVMIVGFYTGALMISLLMFGGH